MYPTGLLLLLYLDISHLLMLLLLLSAWTGQSLTNAWVLGNRIYYTVNWCWCWSLDISFTWHLLDHYLALNTAQWKKYLEVRGVLQHSQFSRPRTEVLTWPLSGFLCSLSFSTHSQVVTEHNWRDCNSGKRNAPATERSWITCYNLSVQNDRSTHLFPVDLIIAIHFLL